MDFSPSVYEHAAFLIGRTPWEVSRDAELMFAAHAEAFLRYRHAPITVGIDIYNLEAEAYGGCVERPSGTGVPAIARPVCRSVDELAALAKRGTAPHFARAERVPDHQTATAQSGPGPRCRIPMVIDVAARLAERFPEADVRVPVSGPFSIASNLLGFETLLCAVLTEPGAVAAALMSLVGPQVAFCEAVARAGLDVSLFESAAAPPLLSPQMFRRVELPALTELVRCAGEALGHAVPCIIGGDTTPILDAVLATGTHYVICTAETDQQAFLAKVWDRSEVRVRVNLSPQVVARGTRERLRAEVERVGHLVAGRENVCLGTGALPYETPPENVLFLSELCSASSAWWATGVDNSGG